jgi:hypothetical protein
VPQGQQKLLRGWGNDGRPQDQDEDIGLAKQSAKNIGLCDCPFQRDGM